MTGHTAPTHSDARRPSSHDAVLALLRASAAHGEVAVIETHMSWVYLVGPEVLKLKKPVRHTFLDFTTLTAREAACREELRLNARLAPGVYLGLTALQKHRGTTALVPESHASRPGDVVDWLIRMKRLPHERMLNVALDRGRVLPRDVDAVVRVLASFYLTAARAPVSPTVHRARLRHELALCQTVLLDSRWSVAGAAEAIHHLQQHMATHREALARRASQGHIVEGHGDLRPEHVCLLKPPVVIDCIEFNAALRQVDPFDELAFLALECRMAGEDWVGAHIIEGCARALGERPPPAVLQIYTAQRALVRARLSLAHLFDPQPRTPERWLPQAQRYVDEARAALAPITPARPVSVRTPCAG